MSVILQIPLFPAKAGTHGFVLSSPLVPSEWTPAFAGESGVLRSLGESK
jgi:hypothetical protein